jgi:N-methylhydantoinase B
VKDGINAVASGISNTMNTPIEVLELSFPVRVDEYALTPDSGGAGTYRGGLAAHRTWTVLGHKARASSCLERTKSPPFGLQGGLSGMAARIWTEDAVGILHGAPGKGGFDVPDGGKIHLQVPGSGGYGDPKGRDPAKLREDLLDGYVTEEAARGIYGVTNVEGLVKG